MDEESSADCDWLATNLIEVSNDKLEQNWTICEEYFARFNESLQELVEGNATTLASLGQTEAPGFENVSARETEATIFENVSARVTEAALFENVSTTLATTLPTEGDILTMFPEVSTLAFMEDIGTEATTTFLKEIIPPKETVPVLGFDIPEVTTKMYLEEIKKFIPAVTTEVFMEEYNIPTTEVYSTANNMSLNSTLCKWYLPTIDQTPAALGNTGIALWVLGFVITFALICMFARQGYFIYKTAHKSFRLHLLFINSIYVIMALMTSIGSGIPRAHAICSAIKDVYMAIGIGHFVDLTIAMYGGENVMAWYVKDRPINLRVVIICKCFFCMPKCQTTKRSVSILKWMVWQMKWSQAAYYLIKLIWRKSLENTLGISLPSSSFLYLHLVNVASFVSGVISLLVIGSLVREDLQEKYNYTIKGKLVRFTILTTKLQRLLFEILEAADVFPCIPPYVSKRFYKNVLKDFIYLVEVLILGTITFFVYTKRGEFEHGNSNQVPQAMLEKELDNHEENGFEEDVEVTTALTSQPMTTESVC